MCAKVALTHFSLLLENLCLLPLPLPFSIHVPWLEKQQRLTEVRLVRLGIGAVGLSQSVIGWDC